MYKYNGEHINNKIQHWAMTNQPSDNMIYKKAWWEHIVFMREKIIPLLYMDMCWDSKKDWSEIEKSISEHYDLVGTHLSKSIKLPVYQFRYKGAVITARYNFHDWEVNVDSPVRVNIIHKGLFNPKTDTFSFQGFPEDRKVKTPYSKNRQNFTVKISADECKFYTFMFLLKHQLDKNYKPVK